MTKHKKARKQPQRAVAWHWPGVLAGGLLVIMVLAAYAPLVRAGFIWDDEDYVVENVTLRSADGLARIWFEIGATRQYYPLVHTTFWFEYHLWQLAPLGYHLVNVALHATSAVLLWRLLLRLRVPGAWLAAALFAVHPVEVESVAWITERKNVLSLALALGAMLCYLRLAPADDEPQGERTGAARWRWYALALALFALALVSKTVVATLPAVLLVIYWWKRGKLSGQSIAPLVPFFALGIGLGLLTVWMEKNTVGATGQVFELSLVERVLVAGRALWFYAGKLAWPYPLVFFYPRWTVDAGVWWQYLYPAAALGVIVALWLARQRLGRGPLAAVLIFAGVLVPALGFFDVYPFRFSFVADHFQYHASIALLALAAAAATLAARHIWRGDVALPRVAGAIVLLLLGVMTFRQTFVYENLETLYRDTIARNPTLWLPLTNLANDLYARGEHEEALQLSRQALAVAPDETEVQFNLGTLLLADTQRTGPDARVLIEAIGHLQAALELNPNFAPTCINLAEAHIAAGNLDTAKGFLEKALQLQPAYLADAHFQYGNLFAARNEPEVAARHYREAVRLRPGYVEAWEKLGETLSSLGRDDEAAQAYREVLRLKPGDPKAIARLRGAVDRQGGPNKN